MKIAPYVERLENSKEYREFAAKHKNAFMIAGFFVLDFENNKNMHQIDYYIPSKKKVAAFTLDKGVKMQVLSLMNSKIPEKLDLNTEIDLDAIPGILEEEMKNRSITADIKKVIAIIQNIDGKKIWNLNCMLSGMGILRANVEDKSKTVLKMEKSSVMDFIQKIPGSKLKQMASGEEDDSPHNIKEEIKRLDEIEKKIELEKQKLEKEALEIEKADKTESKKENKKGKR